MKFEGDSRRAATSYNTSGHSPLGPAGVRSGFGRSLVQRQFKKLLDQLIKDVGQKHVLFGAKLTTIARRYDRDDVLYQYVNEPQKYVEVHLTWSFNIDERWPDAKIYDSFEDWFENKMIPDSKEFEE